MKILHVLGHIAYGGAEVLVARFALYCARNGHTSTIAAGFVSDEALLQELRSAGITVHVFGGGWWSGYQQLRHLVTDMDIVHAHLMPPLYQVALLPRRAHQATVTTEHSSSNRRRHLPLVRFLEGPIYRRYDAVTAVSLAAQQSLASWVPGLQPALIYNGIDYARINSARAIARSELGFNTEDCILVCVGALREEKNQAALIAALDHLPAQFKLVLVGDGVMRSQLQSQVQAAGLESRVRMVGVSTTPEIYLKMADVAVSAARFEGFGLGVLEASAAGLPLAISDVAGHREVIGDAACYFPDLAPASVAAVIEAVAAAPAAASLNTRYPIVETYEAYLLLYKQLLAGRSP